MTVGSGSSLNGRMEMVLQNGDQLPESTRHILDVMVGESRRLTRFVKVILDVSQLEAGWISLNLGPVAVRPLLERAVTTVLTNSKRSILWHIEPELPPLWADEIYFEQIIRNLLTNAKKYSPPDTPVDISANIDDYCLKVSVTDYGPGIPVKQQEVIFNRFERIKQRDNGSQQAWGLGLYFAKALTEAQGGYLTLESPVHSDPDHPGACFIITLPLTEEVPEYG